ncbi:MAG: nuclear transport factor 2 family protein [Alphaproteobacteria bacterium]|nr:nuclear transport factor 2 family protein [Alphaproteobacteria bacterium]
MTEEETVLATLEEYADAYCAKDIVRQMAIFDDGDDISMIGTGADELCAGRSAVEAIFVRNFAEATATRFVWHWRHVTLRESCAVVAANLIIHLEIDGRATEVPVRWTVSLVGRSGGWKWLHRHASSAAGAQDQGAAYPIVS